MNANLPQPLEFYLRDLRSICFTSRPSRTAGCQGDVTGSAGSRTGCCPASLGSR